MTLSPTYLTQIFDNNFIFTALILFNVALLFVAYSLKKNSKKAFLFSDFSIF